MESARRLQQKGDHAAAIIELRNLIAVEPRNTEARKMLAASYNANSEPNAAEDEIRKAIEQGGDARSMRALLGRSLLFQGKFERLLDEIAPDPAIAGADALEIALVRGLAYLAVGNRVDAKNLLTRVVSADPQNADGLLGLAGIAVGENQPDEAAALIERALAANPKSLDAWMLKGDMSIMRRKPEDAIAAYSQVLRIQPANINAHMQLTSLYIDAQRFEDASQHLDAVRSKVRNNPLANYLFALIEFRKKNYPMARQAVAEALRTHPGHTPTLLLAGAIEFASGSFDNAAQHLRALLDRSPGSITARRMLAVSLMRGGQVQRAIEVLEQSLGLAPEDPQLLALIGEAYLHNMDLPRAIPYLERAAKANPKDTRAQTTLQSARLLRGDSARALADLEQGLKIDSGASTRMEILYVATLVHRRQFDDASKAIVGLEKNQPNNPVTHNLKAAILLGKGDTVNARKSLETALALNPRFVPAAVNLANLDLRDKNTRSARRRLEAVLERDPANALALGALSSMGQQLGVTDEVQLEMLERARRANPNSMRTLVLLAEAHLRVNNAQKALEHALAAQNVNPDNPEVLEVLAAAQLALGRPSDALGSYSKLAVQNPNSPGVLYRLATTQAANGNTAGATLTLRKALGLNPNFVPALILLGDIELSVGRADLAIQIAQDLQKRYPKLLAGYVLEGDVHVQQKRFPQALRLYETAEKHGDRSGRLAIKMHMASAQAGASTEGDARLARYIKENPGELSVVAYMADAHLYAGRYPAAIEHYQRVLEKQPNNALILNNLAWASYKMQDRRARQFAEKAHSLAPDNPIILDTYGWILADSGELDRAAVLLQRAVTNAPDSRSIRFNFARVLVKAGNVGQARRELDNILAASGPFEHETEARELLSRIR